MKEGNLNLVRRLRAAHELTVSRVAGIFATLLATCAVYGLLCPTLISAPSTPAVLIGIALGLVTPFGVYLSLKHLLTKTIETKGV